MRKALTLAVTFLLLAAALSAMSSVAAAEAEGREVDSGVLLREWEEYDGEVVVFRGEAVGDVLWRGDYAWIMVNDDHYSLNALHEAGELRGGNSGIGVWMPVAEAEKIGRLGRHGSVGDYLEVKGVFHADCGEHGGDFDIHADSIRVLAPGKAVRVSPQPWKYLVLAASLLFALVTMIPLMRRRLEERRSARALLRRESE